VLMALRLPEPNTPEVGQVPLPTVLVIGGLVLGLVVAAVCRPIARAAARRRRAKAEARLNGQVASVARAMVLSPVRAELTAYATSRTALEQVRTRA